MGVLTREPRLRLGDYRRTEQKRATLGRFLLLHLLILAVFATLSAQLFRMQVVNGQQYELRAEQNRLRVIKVPTQRGLIYDRDGQPLVENVPSFSATLTPADVPKDRREEVYAAIEKILGVPRDKVAGRVATQEAAGDPFSPIPLKTNLDRETAFTLKEVQADLPGVEVAVEMVRRYPTADLMAHILGYVGRISAEEYDALRGQGYGINDALGKTGVESTYEQYLRGIPGRKEVEYDAAGREIQVLGEEPPVTGSNVVLSVDLDLQREVERILRDAMKDTEIGSAVVMDVRTGEILAMVSLPTYDPNVFTGKGKDDEIQRLLTDERKPLLNHAISDHFPPGSTFKIVTGLAALQESLATPNTTIFTGPLKVYNQYDRNIVDSIYRDWNSVGFGLIDLYEAYARSSNVYFHCLAGGCHEDGRNQDGLGVNRLAQYARAFGFGAPTGIDLPNEAPGLVPDPEWKSTIYAQAFPDQANWYLSDTYYFGIGQGFLNVTPLQLLRMVAAVANDGKVLEPTVVHEIRDDAGNVISGTDTRVVNEVPISPENLQVLQRALRYSVTNGLASTAEVPGIGVAGKTGTAEFGEGQERNGQQVFKTHGWFVGYAPYDDPQIAVVIFLHEGDSTRQAAPAAKRIFEYYFTKNPIGRVLQPEEKE